MDIEKERKWFASLKEELEKAYLQYKEPWKQSGFSGQEDILLVGEANAGY